MRSLLFAFVIAAAAAACGGESAYQVRKGAGSTDGSRDVPPIDSPGGSDGSSPDGGSDGAALDAGGEGGSDDAPTDTGFDAGVDSGFDSGVVLPQFLRVWTFDQASSSTDGWARAFGLVSGTITYDGTIGWPNPGSLLLNVPFMNASGGEQLAVQATTAADLTHRHVTAMIRLDSAGPALGRVGYSSTGYYVLVMAPPVALNPGEWTMVTLDVDNPPSGSYIDTSHTDADGGIVAPMASDTRIITVVVSTPFAPGTYSPAVFHVDLVGYY
jgi:hypothetical protein